MRVRVTGEMWWWRVAYLDDRRRPVIHDANELHIPVGRPVVLELESADVIHSFWVPRLSGKLDMIPGRRNLMRDPGRRAGGVRRAVRRILRRPACPDGIRGRRS
jgi:cytochrome c oxidase subunit II